MVVVRKGGKKGRKIGRNARRPGTARRKSARPDLFRKARNVLRCNGEPALVQWRTDRCAKGDNAITVGQAAEAATRRPRTPRRRGK